MPVPALDEQGAFERDRRVHGDGKVVGRDIGFGALKSHHSLPAGWHEVNGSKADMQVGGAETWRHGRAARVNAKRELEVAESGGLHLFIICPAGRRSGAGISGPWH